MMLSGYLWLTIFCIAALLFFGTAIVIAFVGTKDLRDLLTRSKKK